MFSRHQPDVLVVGAGPVGLISALRLAQHSVNVEIIDEEIRTAAHSYALALHPGTLGLLHELGVEPEKMEGSLRVDTVGFYDRHERRAELRLADLPVECPYLLVVRQSHLEDLLERALRDKNVAVRWHTRLRECRPEEDRVVSDIEKLDRVSSGYAIAGMETEVVKQYDRRSRFVIGADGHRSGIRKGLGVDFPTMAPPELFAVFEFECEPPLDTHEVRVALDGRSTNVLWPLPDGRCRWSFQVWDEPEAPYDLHFKSRLAVQVGRDYFVHVTPDLLANLIDERAPWFESWPGRIFWSVLARFERRLAGSAGAGRVWLAGDALHLTGPVGVQSMNVGLREGRDLADRVAGALQDEAFPPDMFDAYGRERILEWRQLLGQDDELIPLEGADEWVVSNRDRILPCLPGSGRELELLAEQMGLKLPRRELAGSP
jgi:2-polyprenyl-6-methoxyphenol hydroxylase-like FAD-dependent oxidoreductase